MATENAFVHRAHRSGVLPVVVEEGAARGVDALAAS